MVRRTGLNCRLLLTKKCSTFRRTERIFLETQTIRFYYQLFFASTLPPIVEVSDVRC